MLFSQDFLVSELLFCVIDLFKVTTLQRKRKRSSSSANLSRKRRRTAVVSPSQPPVEVLNLVPRPRESIPPEDLPALSSMPPSLQPYTAPLQDDGPLRIHNHSVEEYQHIYHEVVDDMMRCVSVK